MKKLFLALLLCGCPSIYAQVPVQLSPLAHYQFSSATGVPLAGGKVYTYMAGTNTALATYSDSTGTASNTNPIILDSGGFANIWLSGSAYKFVVTNSANVTQWTVDNITVAVFPNGNNSFTGNNTFSGTTTFNGATNLNSGGVLSGSFSGSPTLTGNPAFSGTATFNGLLSAPGTIQTDTISGTFGFGGTFALTGHVGSAGLVGEGINIIAGAGGNTAAGGAVNLQGGTGSAGGGNGGSVNLYGANAVSGNSTGGAITLLSGAGVGANAGGAVLISAQTGGGTAGSGGAVTITAGTGGAGGNGGNLTLNPGAAGAGGATGSVIQNIGRTIYQNNDKGTCAATGVDTGTCALDNFSADSDGIINITTAGVPLALGTFTLTFKKAMGTNGAACTFSLANGSGTWNVRATVIATAFGSATAVGNWDNNAVALTAAQIYRIAYHCVGRQ